MNEDLQERFGRSKRGVKPGQQAAVWILPQRLNPKVAEYFKSPSATNTDGGAWLDMPEIPSAEELLDLPNDVSARADGSSSSDIVELVPNRPKGPWESKNAYLHAHYELLREDAIRPLREAVSRVKFTPTASEDAFNGAIGIYEKVHICGVTCSTRGVAVRVTFSLGRTRKKILWEQSKRLLTGSLVVLTPASAIFDNKAIVATVAGRPLAGLEQNPPEIDLFIARPEEQQIDPAVEFLMVEDRSSLYEAYRHTLLALQRMTREPFPLSEHLINIERTVKAPKYVAEHPQTDLTAVLTNNKHESYENVDIINGWPKQPKSDLDASQLDALHRILSKRLAIVQGPPGTGKTFISVQAIKIMLANSSSKDAPIVIACQTNHAIDQILRHIQAFESRFIRLGGRSKDELIKTRTLHSVRQETSNNPLHGSEGPRARKMMKEMEKEFGQLLLPLKPTKLPLDSRTLQSLGLLTEQQANSLEAGASEWVQGQLSNPREAQSPFTIWLGKSLVPVPPKQLPEDFGFDYEEADLEFEQLKELEAENIAKDDEEFENLHGAYFSLGDNFTCRKTDALTDAKFRDILRQQDLWKIPENNRPAVYRYLQREMKNAVLTTFREKTKMFNDQAARRRIGKLEEDEILLKDQKIIGMTTTGLSKYRGLIAALGPKVVLIEEAGETLEAPVTVACLPSLQHLILVGDHQQLRPHCQVRYHEDKPYYLNVSLFERLVRNKVEFSMLSKQRRMIPEIRRLLYPFYGNRIEDHTSVLNPSKRPNVPGMGGVNSFFFTHSSPEQRDEHMSAYNQSESDMIVYVVEYLYYNGVSTEDITVLTFYNGQRRRILKQLRETSSLFGQKFKVVTVDSYQGEENKIILLSLVRSNDHGNIGFLSIANRVCVALSRAQCGFYIFGNGRLLYNDGTWNNVISILANQGPQKDRLKIEPSSRIGEELTVQCSKHGNKTVIRDANDFNDIVGGCQEKCVGELPCSHPCPLLCHPFEHEAISCQQLCSKALPCGHQCSAACGEACFCKTCEDKQTPGQPSKNDMTNFDGKEMLSKASNTQAWTSFAKTEPALYAAIAATPPSSRASPDKQNTASLVDMHNGEITDSMQQLTFGLDGHDSRPQSASPTLIEEKPVGNGTRTRRMEKFLTNATTFSEEHKEDWSNKKSLLD